ncbi:MAG: site-2 protease family protein [Bacillota bacterium]
MSPLQLVLRIPGFLLAISVHEYAHARMAFKLGDDTAERAGRMTLEPWAHIDLVGAAMLILFGFGWARPVPVESYRMRNPRKDMAKVALAGPVANFLVFFVLQIAVVLLTSRIRFLGTSLRYVPNIIQAAANINLGLGVFNLIPVPPLDGSRILARFLPSSMLDFWENLERYGFIILVILLSTGVLTAIMQPVVDLFLRVAQSMAIALSLLLFPVSRG